METLLVLQYLRSSVVTQMTVQIGQDLLNVHNPVATNWSDQQLDTNY